MELAGTLRFLLFGPSIFFAGVSGLCIAGAVVDARLRKPEPLAKLEDGLEVLHLTKRVINAAFPPSLMLRRNMYREDVASLVEQYQADSRRYRSIHNRLQTLIMIGSASTTTIAALNTGKELTWQSVSLTVISFAITVAAMFTGYYKFRERSYFLQQTADAIEEEANAVRLGIGHCSEYGPGQEDEVLKKFPQRVEACGPRLLVSRFASVAVCSPSGPEATTAWLYPSTGGMPRGVRGGASSRPTHPGPRR